MNENPPLLEVLRGDFRAKSSSMSQEKSRVEESLVWAGIGELVSERYNESEEHNETEL